MIIKLTKIEAERRDKIRQDYFDKMVKLLEEANELKDVDLKQRIEATAKIENFSKIALVNSAEIKHCFEQIRIDELLKEGRQALIDSGKDQIKQLVTFAIDNAEKKRNSDREGQIRNAAPWKGSISCSSDSLIVTSMNIYDDGSKWLLIESSLRKFVDTEMQPYYKALDKDQEGLQELQEAYTAAIEKNTDFIIKVGKTIYPANIAIITTSAIITVFNDPGRVAIAKPEDTMKEAEMLALLKPFKSAKGYSLAIIEQKDKRDYPEYFEATIYRAIISIYENLVHKGIKDKIMTITQICNVMNGSDADGRPSDEQKEQVQAGILKMGKNQVIYSMPEKGKPFEVKIRPFLETRQDIRYINGHGEAVYSFTDTPALYLIADNIGQVGHYPLEVNKWPLPHMRQFVMLSHYLLERINGMTYGQEYKIKGTRAHKITEKIAMENIYNAFGEGAALTDKQKASARNAYAVMLDYWKGIVKDKKTGKIVKNKSKLSDDEKERINSRTIITSWKEYPPNKNGKGNKGDTITHKKGVLIDVTQQRKDNGLPALADTKKRTGEK